MRLTAGLLVTELLIGIQALAMTATMPTIARDLDGLAWYGAAFSAYFLAGVPAIARSGLGAGRAGLARSFNGAAAVMFTGTVAAAVAPTMPLFVIARALQGYGGTALYALAYTIVARAYPVERHTQLATWMSMTWIASLLGAPLLVGAVTAGVGWRWTLVPTLVMLALATVLVVPAVSHLDGRVSAGTTGTGRVLLLVAGVGLAQSVGWFRPGLAVTALAGGAFCAWLGRDAVVPRAGADAPGRRRLLLIVFLVSVAFFGAEANLPLVVVGIDGRSSLEGGLIVSAGGLAWAAANWWQSRTRTRTTALLRGGAAVMTLGIAAAATGIAGGPLLLMAVAWVAAGAGMGLVHQCLLVWSMTPSPSGGEPEQVSARFLIENLGIAAGTALGGVWVSAAASGAPLRAMVGGAWATCAVSAVAAFAMLSGSGSRDPR